MCLAEHETVFHCSALYQDLQSYRKNNCLLQANCIGDVWTTPQGMVMVNCDGSIFQAQNLATYGCVIRDDHVKKIQEVLRYQLDVHFNVVKREPYVVADLLAKKALMIVLQVEYFERRPAESKPSEGAGGPTLSACGLENENGVGKWNPRESTSNRVLQRKVMRNPMWLGPRRCHSKKKNISRGRRWGYGYRIRQ
ncbi:hypothetical protein PIB30_058943 [Stylosanthes scabra]|uniref:RNase H type-1 domain-containing protein n=1 Tax=Stylosanthes scabra TaxID=79078 RepID=A0ABU6YIY9_9FABA|nr:hypothetical protein [Stylosanthes scabra]